MESHFRIYRKAHFLLAKHDFQTSKHFKKQGLCQTGVFLTLRKLSNSLEFPCYTSRSRVTAAAFPLIREHVTASPLSRVTASATPLSRVHAASP